MKRQFLKVDEDQEEAAMKAQEDVNLELIKVEVWLKTALQQEAEYKEPHERDPSEIKRYDYYLQAAASEASFALEHLVRAIHFQCHKHPEPSFQLTESLLSDANRYRVKAGHEPLVIEG
ncbi:MAG: hypothetical protein EOP04_30955, partial [Proteobacteria bacterium]